MLQTIGVRERKGTMGALALAGLVLFTTGCTSSAQYRRTIEDQEAEIRALREERAGLKRDREAYLGEVDELSVRLQEANARLAEAPQPAPAAERHPELEELGIGYGIRNGMTVITIPAGITFPSGKAELSAQGKKALKEVAAVLKKSHGTGVYSIEGHTDVDPIKKSSFGSNRELSLARGMAVLKYLVEDCGVPDEQCVLVGHGQYRPVDPKTTDSAKAKNRRVEIVVHAVPR